MDQIVDTIFRPGVGVLAFAIVALTQVIKLVAQAVDPKLKKRRVRAADGAVSREYPTVLTRLWHKVFLQVLPILVGVGLSFKESEFLWGPLGGWERALFGLGLGSVATLVVKYVLRKLPKKFDVDYQKAPAVVRDALDDGSEPLNG